MSKRGTIQRIWPPPRPVAVPRRTEVVKRSCGCCTMLGRPWPTRARCSRCRQICCGGQLPAAVTETGIGGGCMHLRCRCFGRAAADAHARASSRKASIFPTSLLPIVYTVRYCGVHHEAANQVVIGALKAFMPRASLPFTRPPRRGRCPFGASDP